MKLINSVNETKYKTINTMFISDYKLDFLADKFERIADPEEWAELLEDWECGSEWIIYGDASGSECLSVIQTNYKSLFEMLNAGYGGYCLYTNEQKDLYILVNDEYYNEMRTIK